MSMTIAPTYEAIKHEISRLLSIRETPAEFLGTGLQCKDGLLPSIKCKIVGVQRCVDWDCEGFLMLVSLF